MIEDRTKMLVETIKKLKSRGARQNIQRILVKTHTADIAAVLEAVKKDESIELFKMEPSIERRADILSYLNKDLQLWFLEELTREEITQLLSLMDSDDAADLLGRLSDEESKEILESMKRQDSEDVADLMGYPEDSAGGLMSSDYLALKQDMTVKQAVEAIQEDNEESLVAFYIYVINDSEQLIGVVSLKQLLLSRQTDVLKDIMIPSVISVSLDTDQESVAKTVERYDFLCVPVVDDTNKLMGVITVDDVIDVIRLEAEEDLLAMGQAGGSVDVTTWESLRARFPWLLLAFIGGVVCFGIVFIYGYFQVPKSEQLPGLWIVSAFIPLMLAIGTMTGTQAATVAIGILRTGLFDKRKIMGFLRKELIIGFIFSLFFGGLVFILGVAIFPEYNLTIPFAGAMTLQILISMMFGSLFPIGIQRMGMDPTVAPIPLFTAIADISAIAILFGLYHAS